MVVYNKELVAQKIAQRMARFATEALLEELHLTPKPGLVDDLNNGSHRDLTLQLMETSAYTLRDCFFEIAFTATGQQPSQQLREQLAVIGCNGERAMLQVTGNINTHRGAIWALGLLAGAAAVLLSQPESIPITSNDILVTAGAIAAYEDRQATAINTHGSEVRKKYRVRSAREEAVACFPSLRQVALPAWSRYDQEPENIQRLNVFLSLMAIVDDTCILYRSNLEVLREVQRRSKFIMDQGGLGIHANWHLYVALNKYITDEWVSPGGSADLLAATLFLQKIIHHYKIK